MWLIKKFSVLYRTRIFVAVFTGSHRIHPVHSLSPYFFDSSIHFNIILSSIFCSIKWSFVSCLFEPHFFCSFLLLKPRNRLSATSPELYHTKMFAEKYQLRSSSVCNCCHPTVTSFHTGEIMDQLNYASSVQGRACAMDVTDLC